MGFQGSFKNWKIIRRVQHSGHPITKLMCRLFTFVSSYYCAKVIDIMYTVRKMKWSWAGHINRLKDNRWTSRVTTWRPYDKKRRQGRPAKRWRDDLDKYWSDTIWQRTAQDRVIWRRHAEVFAQPRDTTAASACLMMMMRIVHLKLKYR